MKQDDLHELVISLTPAEKRYVRLFASRHIVNKTTNSLRLFDALDSMEVYDAKELGRLLKGNVIARNLSLEKKYLSALIFKSMRSYHEAISIDKLFRDQFSNIEFLYSKRLYNQSLKELAHLKSDLKKFDRHTLLLDLLLFEQKILVEKQPTDLQKLLKEKISEVEALTALLMENAALEQVKNEVIVLSRTRFHLRDEDVAKTLNTLFETAHFGGAAPESFTAAHHYLNALAIRALCLGDHKEASAYYEKLLALWEKHAYRIKVESLQYKKILSNYLNLCHANAVFDKIPVLLERIRSIPCRTAEEEAEQFQNVYYIELLYLLNTNGYEKLEPLVKHIEEGMVRYKTKINKARELMFYYNLAIGYFISENWKASLHWISKIINTERTEHRGDVQAFARLLRLILFYELNKHDLLEYELLNVERYLRKQKSWFDYEATLTKFLEKLLDAPEKEKKKQFELYAARLEKFAAEKTKSTLPGLAELQLWANHHVNEKPIRQLLQAS
jgi:hypothetical protein